MQGARDILVAVIHTYISEESLAQNAHAENSEHFVNQGTLIFLHISAEKKTKPVKETLQFLTMVLMKTSSGIGCSIIWYMVTKVLEEQDPLKCNHLPTDTASHSKRRESHESGYHVVPSATLILFWIPVSQMSQEEIVTPTFSIASRQLEKLRL